VVVLVPGEGRGQVPLVQDQEPVQELLARRASQAHADRAAVRRMVVLAADGVAVVLGNPVPGGRLEHNGIEQANRVGLTCRADLIAPAGSFMGVSGAGSRDRCHFWCCCLLSGPGRFWESMGNGGRAAGGGMDPVRLILTALAAGAGLGLKDAATSTVSDAYRGLTRLVRRRLAGRPDGELVLARHEQDPQVWDNPLAQELTAAGASEDTGLIAAAQAFMKLTDAAGSAAGKYAVSAAGHSVAAGRDVKITASNGGTAAGVIHGNVAPPGPTRPGPAQG
jgi:hypothetical protein